MTQGVLVLNSDFSPINVTSLHRGFSLVYKGKAEILKSSDEPIVCGIKQYVRPLIIRLLNYVNFQRRRIRVNRHRIMRRDGYTCVYCGNKKELTIDHVIPKSKGGDNSWKNLVTCCSPCNLKKGDKLLHETNMRMIKKPTEPNIFSDSAGQYLQKVWSDFQNSF
jgi:5-methylcytosine-specific restriction endonuclease McrA